MLLDSLARLAAQLPSYIIMGLSAAFVLYLCVSCVFAYWNTR